MTAAKLPCLVDLIKLEPSPYIAKEKKNHPHILLVEDNPLIQVIHQDMLKSFQCLVDIVSTGEAALIKLEQDDYDLVLLDIGLPGISGIEVMMDFNRYKNYSKTPVIILTAFTDQSLINQCLSIGIKQVLHKPINITELKRVIDFYT